ncbi:MAG: type II secretion system protein [Patescibacteria group bacterium]|nr:type II secretion system protein [Patescibacteria group bacterium]
MLKKLNKSKSDGFTIIEVMIVLAIAGLILLIVFLAVPALQRNARNTQRKNDVGGLLSAVAEYSSNHQGSLPATAQFDAAFSESLPKLGYYTTPANINWDKVTAARTTNPAAPAGVDSVKIYNYAKCTDATTSTFGSGASVRSFVAMYNVESSSGVVPQCQES